MTQQQRRRRPSGNPVVVIATAFAIAPVPLDRLAVQVPLIYPFLSVPSLSTVWWKHPLAAMEEVCLVQRPVHSADGRLAARGNDWSGSSDGTWEVEEDGTWPARMAEQHASSSDRERGTGAWPWWDVKETRSFPVGEVRMTLSPAGTEISKQMAHRDCPRCDWSMYTTQSCHVAR